MVQLCPRCQRANPQNAVFCHFDGCLLRQGAAGAATGQLLQEFVFPSGRRCRTFDELAQGCYAEWEDARHLLRDGNFTSFLASIGRADLAKTAREAQAQADGDIALTDFVGALPASQVQGPKLGLSPRRMVLGPVKVGEQRAGRVVIINEGRGQLQGKVTVAEGGQWLKIGEGNDPHTFPIKTAKDQPIALRADCAGLIAGQGYSGKLVVVTNGGIAEVPVRLDLQARPFPRAPYQGANDPKDLARKMRDNPRPAVALLESGEIARWFASNGWAYPIAGACAPGLAAVQQYFEEMGLAKAPQIIISEQQMRFQCTVPVVTSGQVTIRSPARKLVYGRAASDSPWLKVTTPGVSGQAEAQIGFAIDTTLMDENRTYQGTLKVIANAGQHFSVAVQVEVDGNRKGWFTSARPAAPSAAAGRADHVPLSAAPPIMTQAAALPPLPSPLSPPSPVGAAGRADHVAAAPAPSWLDSGRAQSTSAGRAEHVPAPPLPAPTGRGDHVQAQVLAPVRPVPRQESPITLTPATSAGRAEHVPYSLAPQRVNLAQAIILGAILGFLWRMVLVFPADLYARMLGNPARSPVPGSLEAWLLAPPADETYLRLFVLAAWWVGALIGVVLAWQKGGGFADLVCGLIAGAVAGLAGSATVACVLVLGDALPRSLLNVLLAGRSMGPAVATPLWIITAAMCWIVEGAALGLVLAILGRAGASVLALLGSPAAWLLRAAGLGNLADFFALRGN